MSDLRGHVFQLMLTDHYDGLPHPFVVVLEIEGQRECLVVPAFTVDGYRVSERIKAYQRMGYRQDQISIRLNNAKHIAVNSPDFEGHEAEWFIADFRRLARNVVIGGTHIGIMDSNALIQITRGVVASAQSKGSIISPSLLKRLLKLSDL